MLIRKLVFAFTLFVCLGSVAYAQSLSEAAIVPLIVDAGFPLKVVLTEKLRFKENDTVHGRIIEPVYAFDREVVPSGSEVLGKITGFQKPGKWKRFLTMLGGDFTPLREPQITFDTLVLPGGTRIPIETSVVPGTEKIVGLDADKNPPASDLKTSLASTMKEPAKERLKDVLWNMAPYHPQSLPVGASLQAVLRAPLHFGEAVFQNGELDEIGSQPIAGSIASVRLTTPLDSRKVQTGTPVEGLLVVPLFSSDHRLIFPVGSVLRGEVLDVNAARTRHRNGELAFRFTTIELPVSWTLSTLEAHRVEGNLVGVQVAHDMKDLRIDANGAARIAESKKRFIAPAFAFVKAGTALNASADPFGQALLGAYRSKFLKQIFSNEPGFGLPASISGAMIPPVAIGFGFFGAARAIYSNFLGRGKDIRLPANTEMEIRVENDGPAELDAIP